MTPTTQILQQIKEFERKCLVSRLVPFTAPYVEQAPEARAALKRMADGGNAQAKAWLEQQERPATNVVVFPGYATEPPPAASECDAEPPTTATMPTAAEPAEVGKTVPVRDQPHKPQAKGR
jgi:hypothetical protein